MPQRPSKKVKVHRGAKPGAAPEGESADQAELRRQRNATAKSIIGKFQGRKSI